ncbi:MAG: GNAT family N-acetyltransferase [Lentisphaeria bacterium]|jgi:predicted N-acetyltransferase YhbS|nr:GNAT family N-acetyltransferase [Lentisphaeria bacterium]
MDVRLGLPADYPAVMERVATSFRAGNPGHALFEDIFPDTVSPATMNQWRLAFHDGELAGGIQLVPRPLRLAGLVDLPAMGLGNVFCYPAIRGQGVMSALLRRCLGDMRQEGIAICLLGGDRTRYGHFGWEHCGGDRRLSLSRNVKRHDQFQPASILELRPWRGADADSSRMAEAYHALPYHCARPGKFTTAHLDRPGQVVWLCDDPACGFAYISVRGRDILEYAGDIAAGERILRFLLDSGEWSATLPPEPGCGPWEKLLLGYARHFTVAPTGMGCVICLAELLRAYLPLLERRLADWQGTFSLASTDGEAVLLAGNQDGLTIAEGPAATADLSLSRNDLALLLFGPFPPPLGNLAHHPVLRRAFPLPLHWQPLAHV